jgi:hypothetical protein
LFFYDFFWRIKSIEVFYVEFLVALDGRKLFDLEIGEEFGRVGGNYL